MKKIAYVFRFLSTVLVVIFLLLAGLEVSPGTRETPDRHFYVPFTHLNLIPVPQHVWQVKANTALGISVEQEAHSVVQRSIVDLVTSRSVYVMDELTGSILLEYNAATEFPPASTTKLLTALVAVEAYDLDQVLSIPDTVLAEGSIAGFAAGERYTVKDLLAVLLVSSANDVAEVFAFHFPGGRESFVQEMNKKAGELGLKNSHFVNPSGLDAFGQKTTARDLAILADVALNHPTLKSLSSLQTVDVAAVPSSEFPQPTPRRFFTTHQLLGVMPEAVAGKTGTTEGARQVLITQFAWEGHSVIVVVMGSTDRYVETVTIFEWLRQNYTWVSWSSALGRVKRDL